MRRFKRRFEVALNEFTISYAEEHLPMDEIRKGYGHFGGMFICSIGEVIYTEKSLRLEFNDCPQIDSLVKKLKLNNLNQYFKIS